MVTKEKVQEECILFSVSGTWEVEFHYELEKKKVFIEIRVCSEQCSFTTHPEWFYVTICKLVYQV